MPENAFRESVAEAQFGFKGWSQHPPIVLDDRLDHLEFGTLRVARDEGDRLSNLLWPVKVVVVPHEPVVVYEIPGISTSSKVFPGNL